MRKAISQFLQFESKLALTGLFLLCLITRLITTIYYIEDPDSLRFALAVKDFDLAALQPHFPGYPVFVFLSKVLSFIIGKFSIAFSVIGGVSVFLIIYFALKINLTIVKSIKPWLLVCLIFFNPLIWIMSNRYMPDLLGLAILVAAFYYLLKQEYLILFILTALLAGVRLSYVPALVLPVFYVLYIDKKRIQLIALAFLTFLIWFVPVLIDTGWSQLLHSANRQTEGHFYSWGGTVLTETLYLDRLLYFIRSIWADGLGGFWPERNQITIITSLIFIISCLVAVNKIGKPNKLLAGSIIIYTLWVYFYQNITFNSRHIMPLVIPLLFFTGTSLSYFTEHIKLKLITFVFIVSYAITGLMLAIQHKKPSAIYQLTEQLRQEDKITIVSTELINYYLMTNGVEAKFIDITELNSERFETLMNKEKLITIGNFTVFDSFTYSNEKLFYHNPYVNRIWPEIRVREYNP